MGSTPTEGTNKDSRMEAIFRLPGDFAKDNLRKIKKFSLSDTSLDARNIDFNEQDNHSRLNPDDSLHIINWNDCSAVVCLR